MGHKHSVYGNIKKKNPERNFKKLIPKTKKKNHNTNEKKQSTDSKAIQSIVSKHSGIKLEVNNRRTTEKSLKIEN